jgi:hypothetical protein
VRECAVAFGLFVATNEPSIVVWRVYVGLGVDNQNTHTLLMEYCKLSTIVFSVKRPSTCAVGSTS